MASLVAASAAASCSLSWANLVFLDASRARSRSTSIWNGWGSIRNSTSPLLTGTLAWTGTSMTVPRTFGTICTTAEYIRPSWLTGWKTDRKM